MAAAFNRSMQDVDRQSPRESRGSPYTRPSRPAERGTVEPNRWQHDRFNDGRGGGRPRGPPVSNVPTAKLAIQGLHYEVSETELKDLFGRIGPTAECFIRYDRSGRSTGAATVTFERVRDAIRAKEEYDGANAKGQPIAISFVEIREARIAGTGNARGGDLFNRLGGSSSEDLSKRIGGGFRGEPPSHAPKGPAAGPVARAARPGPHRSVSGSQEQARREDGTAGRGTGGRGGGVGAGRGRGGRGGEGGAKRAAATADSLDAELDAFMSTPSNTSESMHAPKKGDIDSEMQ